MAPTKKSSSGKAKKARLQVRDLNAEENPRGGGGLRTQSNKNNLANAGDIVDFDAQKKELDGV